MAAKVYDGVNHMNMALSKLLTEAGYEAHNIYPFTSSITINGTNLTVHVVTAPARDYGTAQQVKLTIKPTEACCALNFCHTFAVTDNCDEKLVKLVCDFIFARMPQFIGAGANNRVMVNMVEKRPTPIKDPLAVVVPVENPEIIYKPLWNYLHQNCARVNTMLMPNHNTGRIIHHMECIFAPDYFNNK